MMRDKKAIFSAGGFENTFPIHIKVLAFFKTLNTIQEEGPFGVALFGLLRCSIDVLRALR